VYSDELPIKLEFRSDNSIQDGQKILECPEEALFEVQGHN
jgi:hypothetical protein